MFAVSSSFELKGRALMIHLWREPYGLHSLLFTFKQLLKPRLCYRLLPQHLVCGTTTASAVYCAACFQLCIVPPLSIAPWPERQLDLPLEWFTYPKRVRGVWLRWLGMGVWRILAVACTLTM